MPLALRLLTFGLCLNLSLYGAGCQRFGGMPFRDTVRVSNEQALVTLPKSAPKVVYVEDFALDAKDFQGDQGLHGALPNLAGGQLAGQLGQRLPQPLVTTDPAAKAREIVNTLAIALVADLREQGVPAERIPAGNLPQEGWLISGQFLEVDEGNRLRRAALGMGQGASQMVVAVNLSDLSDPAPRTPFAAFGTIKEAGAKPGAAVILNPYAAAAKFIMEKNASEKDTRKTASEIATELLKYRDQIRGIAK